MKKTRLVISFALVVCILLSSSIVSFAASSGSTGTCTWKLSSGTLTISGDGGSMADYAAASDQPWYSSRTSITKVVVEDGVEYIGNRAFYGLTSVTAATIGADVEAMGSFAFRGCTALKTLDYNASKCETAGTKTTMVFYECNNLSTVNFADGVKYIPPYLFLYCTGLKEITIPESVYRVSEYAFSYCSSLETVNLPDKLTELPEYMFYECPALANINVPNMLSNIGNYAFYNCSALTDMELPATVTQIGYGAFDGCTSLNIKTVSGSYAELFAKQYGISYTATSVSTPSVELTVNTTTNAAFLNGYLTLGVKFDQPLDGECVHAAFYNAKGNVVNYFIFPVFGDTEFMSIPIDADDVVSATYAKIFVWDGLENCMPISPAETITIPR